MVRHSRLQLQILGLIMQDKEILIVPWVLWSLDVAAQLQVVVPAGGASGGLWCAGLGVCTAAQDWRGAHKASQRRAVPWRADGCTVPRISMLAASFALNERFVLYSASACQTLSTRAICNGHGRVVQRLRDNRQPACGGLRAVQPRGAVRQAAAHVRHFPYCLVPTASSWCWPTGKSAR